ncbi:plasmid stabilization system protein [mine drainage metagenome]|uniref:Plasmid stabilization system protein n=1 Tax=mine drainage metagenome TaxID=410659 RepID=T1AXM3_9ZZZZ
MSYTVLFSPKAEQQLAAIERYIAEAAGSDSAARYVDAIVTYCESMVTFPQHGQRRDDLMPGLLITHYRGRAVIAFLVDTDAETVSVVGVFYGGQDYETLLQDTD